jgi:UDP-3-O-[3-hydroxymyristoyl] glucosamine N-acyltransferase
MPTVKASEIAELLGATYKGDPDKQISGVRSLGEAKETDLTFLANPKYAPQVATTRAGLILIDEREKTEDPRLIRVKDAYYAVARVLQQWFASIPLPEGVAATARIDPSAKLGRNVRIGSFVSIGPNVTIGDDVAILESSTIGADSSIGSGTVVYPNVTIYHRSIIGERCILHSQSVIGSDGYGFATYEGRHHKIPQIGIVRIENDVEIGAGTKVDRAALGETVIGEGTKIDNLVQIGHNVRIGRHCLIVSQVGIAGSTEIGDYVVFGGQAGAAGHIRIGSRVQVAAQSAVMKSWDGPVRIAGTPARPLRDHLRSEAMVRRLPELIERLERLEKRAGIEAPKTHKEDERE